MAEQIIFSLAMLLLLAVGAQWLAWRLRLPSILLLLSVGFIIGPITGIFRPDQLMGNLLFPEVSLAVSIILFEGGLTLQFRELPRIGSVILRLISLSALVTWALAGLGAYFILGLDASLSVLLGAVLIVTGPTVVGPLLRQIRPKGRAGIVLKWEGILIDPVGAVLAVLVFEVLLHGELGQLDYAAVELARGVGQTIIVGGFMGMTGAGLLILAFRRHLVPDYLHNAVTLMIVVVGFAVSNFFQPESGLLTTTIMGVILANQTYVSVRHIVEFTEDLQVLLIGSLFILLSSRVSLADITSVGWQSLLFLVLLIVVVRPLSALVATVFSDLTWRDWLFISWMAPRGIVAASVASIFAFELQEANYAGAERLVPMTFLVIVGTVLFYGLTAEPVARALKLSERNPQGLVIVGAHTFSRGIAQAVQSLGFRVVLLDTNRKQIQAGRMEGLNTHYGNALSEHTLEALDLGGVGRMLAMTGNNEVNSLAALHFPEVFSRAEVYQLSLGESSDEPPHLRGRILFGRRFTFATITDLMERGAQVKATKITDQFQYDDLLAQYEDCVAPLFIVRDTTLQVLTVNTITEPKPGETLISLVWEPGEGEK